MKNKKEVQEIALEILDYIATLEEGVEISTGEVIRNLYGGWNDNHLYGIKGDEYEEYDLVAIDYAVKRNASKKGLRLDNSKYDGMVIGLPHNIGYIVTRKKAR